MLSLQILSFGGLLKCGLISEWREESEEGWGRQRRGAESLSKSITTFSHSGVMIALVDPITYGAYSRSQ